MKNGKKSGFTLLELLVVMAILAILIGVSVASFGGATESARAAKCIANLKSLGSAANGYAMGKGNYPWAGSFELREQFGATRAHIERVGWISWLSLKTGDDKKISGLMYPATSHQSAEICPYYGTGNKLRDRFALTHGSMWTSAGKNDAIYVCPTHKRLCEAAKLGSPVFSYVMNADFGFDTSLGKEPIGFFRGDNDPGGEVGYGSINRPDRTLLFAEIQGQVGAKGEFKAPMKGSDVYSCDAVLNYRASVKGKTLGDKWKGTPESIGFNHKGSRNKYFAHVVFADGHTEKLEAADTKSKGGINYEQLTALLCEGREYSFDGASYQAVDEGQAF